MALDMGYVPTANGGMGMNPSEDAEFYTQLLLLRDSILAGQNARFKLPPSAIAQLQATASSEATTRNHSAFATNQKVQSLTSLPGLNGTFHNASQTSAGLDPIFLEKSDSLVRAEGQLKRQRIERDLQAQVEQRKHTFRDKDLNVEGPSQIDVDGVFSGALRRVSHVSGLKPVPPAASPSSGSFDENDYYSSQVESEWSSDASPGKQSDKGTGTFPAENLRGAGAPQTSEIAGFASKRRTSGSKIPTHSHEYQDLYNNSLEDAYEIEGEDDEYTPPEAAAFDNYRGGHTSAMDMQQSTEQDDDDDSEYEPGDITQDSNAPTPQTMANQTYQPSPQVPVIRNHLTHIAAPQPNRVSPLATAKGPSIELELVNGRPEIAHKPQPRSVPMQSRASSASPPGNGGSGKKNRNKKRKRESDFGKRKKKRDRQNNGGQAQSPISPDYREPYIKDEPISPPPFGNLGTAPAYQERHNQYMTTEIDLAPPRYAQVHSDSDAPRSSLRYEYAQPVQSGSIRVASPAGYRPAQRGNQDLRRIASHQYALRAASPESGGQTPAMLYRPLFYGQEPAPPPSAGRESYQEGTAERQYVQYARPPSPPRLREYRDSYASGAQSPAPMPPPSTRRIVVDQYGNRYYAAEPAATPAPANLRASVAPIERRPLPDLPFDRAASRVSTVYPQQPPALQYEPIDNRAYAAPSAAARQPPPEQAVEYVDANGYRVRAYSTKPNDNLRYGEDSAPLTYESARRYEMPPPQALPPREQTSPIYDSHRAYSVRPEQLQPPAPSYVRQASVALGTAPVQYARQDVPPQAVRAMSMMPGPDLQRQSYAYAPQPVKYVDQYGQEVFPQEVRQVSEFRYQ